MPSQKASSRTTAQTEGAVAWRLTLKEETFYLFIYFFINP